MEDVDESSSENNIIIDGIFNFSAFPTMSTTKKLNMGKDVRNE